MLYDAATGELKASGSGTGLVTYNTGADVLPLAKGRRVQAMVYDTDQSGDNIPDHVRLSWDYNGAVGNLDLGGTSSGGELSDPDVILTNEGGYLLAKVVYLQLNASTGKHRTQYQVFSWDAGTSKFVPYASPNYVDLGQTVNSIGELREHASPNIDANITGYTAIVWEESIIEKSHVVVTSASYSMAYDVDIKYGYGYATVLTSNQQPYCSRGSIISGGALRLLDQSLAPDVAVGSQNHISFVYNHVYVDFKTYQTVSLLTVRQTTFTARCESQGDNPVFSASFNEVDKKEWAVGLSGVRIAASPLSTAPLDVEVVGNWAGGDCVVDRGPVSYWGISNVGKSGGAFRPGATSVIPDVNRELYSGQAVVTYSGADGYYTVAWVGQNYPGIGKSQDVWARQMKDGYPTYDGISRVHGESENNQNVPSIAGRNLYRETQYVFANDNGGRDIRYKLASSNAGQGPLSRPSASVEQPTSAAASDEALQVYPNPSTQATSFVFFLQPNEKGRTIEIMDLAGRKVDVIQLPAAAAGRQEVRWAKHLPAGSYTARLVTSLRSEVVKLEKAAE
ncbi:hypothetical protein GCM10028821_15660 [Hymenobacter jeollabukensis]